MVALASLDCGTNSTRLLISELDGRGQLTTLERRCTITRLGERLGATGRLDTAAIERTLDVLRDYRAAMDAHGARAVRAIATSAVRDACNGGEFLDAAEAVLRVRPELLSGEEEGRLAFRGATSALDPSLAPFLVVDIGGGSTEIALGAAEVHAVRSIDVGCVRVTEKFLAHDPPRPEELSNAIGWVRAHLEELLREEPAMGSARTLVGLAGTVTTIAAVEMGLPAWDSDRVHHFRLTRRAVEDVFRTLACEALADRVHNPGLEEARADVIVGGCCVLVAILRGLDLDEVLVSELDILDGLAASLAAGAGAG